jgi:hypothetical protein
MKFVNTAMHLTIAQKDCQCHFLEFESAQHWAKSRSKFDLEGLLVVICNPMKPVSKVI